MGRLIDEDALKKHIKEVIKKQNGKNIDLVPVGELMVFIDREPTAYDPDKVVEQLNDKFRVVRTDEDLEWNRAMDDAITIVKGGGVDGN